MKNQKNNWKMKHQQKVNKINGLRDKPDTWLAFRPGWQSLWWWHWGRTKTHFSFSWTAASFWPDFLSTISHGACSRMSKNFRTWFFLGGAGGSALPTAAFVSSMTVFPEWPVRFFQMYF